MSCRRYAEIVDPAFGYKTHISTDRTYGLIRKWKVTDAASYDGRRLHDLIDPDNTAAKVWADTAYRSQKTETFLKGRHIASMTNFRKPPG